MKSPRADAASQPQTLTPIARVLEHDRSEKGLTQPEYVELIVKTARRQFKARGIDTKRLDRFSFDGYRSWLRKRPVSERDGFDEWMWWPVFSEITGLSLAQLTEARFSDLLSDDIPEMAALRRRHAAAETKLGKGKGKAAEAIDEIQSRAVLDEAMKVLQEFRATNQALEAKVEKLTEGHAADIVRIMELLEGIGVKKSELRTLRAKTSAARATAASGAKSR